MLQDDLVEKVNIEIMFDCLVIILMSFVEVFQLFKYNFNRVQTSVCMRNACTEDGHLVVFVYQ